MCSPNFPVHFPFPFKIDQFAFFDAAFISSTLFAIKNHDSKSSSGRSSRYKIIFTAIDFSPIEDATSELFWLAFALSEFTLTLSIYTALLRGMGTKNKKPGTKPGTRSGTVSRLLLFQILNAHISSLLLHKLYKPSIRWMNRECTGISYCHQFSLCPRERNVEPPQVLKKTHLSSPV